MAEDWSAMCKASAPWQSPQAFTLCRLPEGHEGDHERYGRTWAHVRAAARGEST